MQILLKFLGASLIIISLSISITSNITFYNEIIKLNDQNDELRVDLASNLLLNKKLKEQVENMTLQIDNLSLQVSLLNSNNLKLNNKNLNLTKQLISENKKSNELTNRFKSLKNEKGVTMASYEEVKRFLREDKTDKNKWTKRYDCSHFAADLVRNALNKGILACTVELEFEDGGHIITYFPLSDRDGIYIEPQEDKEVKGLRTKINYCDLVNWDCSWNNYILGIACSCN